MSGITLTEVDDATIATPASGKATLFLDDAIGPAYKDDTGTVHSFVGADGELDYTAHGNTGASEAIDWNTNVHSMIVNAATVTVTFSNVPTTGTFGVIHVLVIQDGTGGRDIDWPAAVQWGDAGEPTWTGQSANEASLITFETIDGGTTVYAAVAGRPGPQGPAGADGADGAMDSGTSFPGSPTTGDLFWRTDLGQIFFYDGTRWLTTQLFSMDLRWLASGASQSWSATQTAAHSGVVPHLNGGSDIWLVSHRASLFIGAGTALSGSHKWVVTVRKYDVNDSATTFATGNLDSGSSSINRFVDTTIGALLNNGTVHYRIASTWTKTGTPGAIQVTEQLYYRIVAT